MGMVVHIEALERNSVVVVVVVVVERRSVEGIGCWDWVTAGMGKVKEMNRMTSLRGVRRVMARVGGC